MVEVSGSITYPELAGWKAVCPYCGREMEAERHSCQNYWEFYCKKCCPTPRPGCFIAPRAGQVHVADKFAARMGSLRRAFLAAARSPGRVQE